MKKEPSWVIYCHTHTDSGRRYVGLTKKTMLARWNQHVYNAESKRGKGCAHLWAAIRKYGKDAFDHQILQVCETLEEANAAEQEWIEKLEARNPEKGFNLARGGAHTPHPIRNPWDRPGFREQQSISKGRKREDPVFLKECSERSRSLSEDPAFREKLSLKVREAYVKYPEFRGKIKSSIEALWRNPDYREKVTDACRLATKNPEVLERISKSARDHASTPEGKKFRSLSSKDAWNDPSFRAARTAESRERAKSPEWRAKCSPKRHFSSSKTHCLRGHEFTVKDGRRICRLCACIRQSAYYARAKATKAV